MTIQLAAPAARASYVSVTGSNGPAARSSPSDSRRRSMAEGSTILPFGRPARRFVALRHIGGSQWQPAVFVGWFLDPNIPPGRPCELGVARYRAKLAAERLGLPVILDRVADWRGGVWDGAA